MYYLLIEDNKYSNFFPLTNVDFLWNISCGIFTPYERYKNIYNNLKSYSIRFNIHPYSLLKSECEYYYNEDFTNIRVAINCRFIPSKELILYDNTLHITKDGEFIGLKSNNLIPKDVIDRLIEGDINSLKDKYAIKEISDGILLNSVIDLIKYNSQIINYDFNLIRKYNDFVNIDENIYIHKNAKIYKNTYFEGTSGPIIIDCESIIKPFTIIEGPAYIGKNSLIDSAKIRSGVSIKNNCKIGGEVEESIIESYSNKHHEGFLGHSYVGSWVNIGAMATTSDLKNNYGNVSITTNGTDTINTKMIKFGSIICNYSKIGIGVMLNTGSVIREGSNIFLEENIFQNKYFPPFSWGKKDRYKIDRFIEDLKIMMSRRKVELKEERINFLKSIY